MVIANDLDLEIGWLPKVIEMSGNSKIQFRSAGYCNASEYVTKKQVIKNFNRSMGDIHPMGNPHYSISFSQMIIVSNKIKSCLLKIEGIDSRMLEKNYKSLIDKFNLEFKKLKEMLQPLKKLKVITYHREFIYYLDDFGIQSVGTIEKVPGVLPSSAHLFHVSKLAKSEKVSLLLASRTNPRKYIQKFKEITSIPDVILPMHMVEEFKSYFEYQSFIAKEILKSVKTY